jgi:hypothetical protein
VGSSHLSRRDYRTQPGANPGTDKKGPRPESGGRKVFPPWMPNDILNEFLPPL